MVALMVGSLVVWMVDMTDHYLVVEMAEMRVD